MANSESGSAAARSNVELKARLHSLSAARAAARELATDTLGTRRQVDTYFRCDRGRLKLREQDRHAAELIWYERPDQQSARTSRYYLLAVDEPVLLKQLLVHALGVRCVVDKQREIYLVDNVRIHLDEVQQLGCFLEFEAVLGPSTDVQQGAGQVAELWRRFRVAPGDIVPGSYADLLGAMRP